jgi:hypothetical protein
MVFTGLGEIELLGYYRTAIIALASTGLQHWFTE